MPKSKNKTVIVLGNARSGTSMTSEVLENLGVPMDFDPANWVVHEGKDLRESWDANVINQHIWCDARGEEYISPVGFDRQWWLPFPTPDKMEAHLGKYDDAIKGFIKKKKGTWGFKNPKTTLAIKHWLPHLKNPYFVMVHRNPLSVAASWMKIHPEDVAEEYAAVPNIESLMLVENNYINSYATIAIQPYPHIHLSYEKMIHQPEAEVRRLAKFLELRYNSNAMAVINSPKGY